MSKNCVQCHSPIADDAKFCMICGTTQPETTDAAPQQAPVQPQAAPETPAAPVPPVYGSSAQSSTGSTQSGSQSGSTNSEYVYPADKKVDAGIACLLSVLFPGVGQMVNGQVVKGIVLLGVAIVVGPMTCGIVNVADAIVAGIDAYKCTKALEEGITLRKWSFFGKP